MSNDNCSSYNKRKCSRLNVGSKWPSLSLASCFCFCNNIKRTAKKILRCCGNPVHKIYDIQANCAKGYTPMMTIYAVVNALDILHRSASELLLIVWSVIILCNRPNKEQRSYYSSWTVA